MSAEGSKWIQKPRYGLSRTIDEMAKPSKLTQFRAIVSDYLALCAFEGIYPKVEGWKLDPLRPRCDVNDILAL
jgi:hypothetical protein